MAEESSGVTRAWGGGRTKKKKVNFFSRLSVLLVLAFLGEVFLEEQEGRKEEGAHCHEKVSVIVSYRFVSSHSK